MSWQNKAKKLVSSRWIKFTAENPSYVIYFADEPTEVVKTVQVGDRKGEQYTQMSFPVRVDDEDKILEPNRSLLTQLLNEDEENPIIGRTLLIKCLDLKGMRNWSIRSVENQSDITKFAHKSEDKKAKEKFMEGVKAHAKKTKASKEPKVEEVEEDAKQESTSEPGQPEENEVDA